jgi:flagellar hook-associated protein 3 FlgL
MRVTQQSQTSAMRADLALVSSRLSNIQRQIASGRQLERASDDPAGALEALRYRRSLRSYEQYDRNIGDAKMWLGTADSALEAIDGRLTRAQDLTIQADNGSLGPAARTAIATELRAIADEMVGLGNTRHLGRPIFGGNTGNPQAYDPSGAFIGDDGVVDRAVSSGTSYQVNVTGPQVFGMENPGDPINGNTFEMLREIADRVEAGVTVSAGLDAINRSRTTVHDSQATLGARLASLENLESRNGGVTIEMRSALSETEDVDLAEAILDLKGHEAAYTAALSVTGRILDRSLLDFLR